MTGSVRYRYMCLIWDMPASRFSEKAKATSVPKAKSANGKVTRGNRGRTRPTIMATSAAPKKIWKIAIEKTTATTEAKAHHSATSSAVFGKRQVWVGVSVINWSQYPTLWDGL